MCFGLCHRQEEDISEPSPGGRRESERDPPITHGVDATAEGLQQGVSACAFPVITLIGLEEAGSRLCWDG